MQYLLYTAYLISTVSAQSYANLTNYAIVAATTVTSTGGNTYIFGDIALSPGISITGLTQNQSVFGTIHIGDQQALEAKQSLNVVFDTLGTLTADRTLTVSDLSTLTLNPGIYSFSTAAISLNGNLTLSGAGLFLFQISTTFITTQNCNIMLQNGAVASQIYFRAGSSITIAMGCTVYGLMFAGQSITVDGARVYGGLYARNAAVTIRQSSIINATGSLSSTTIVFVTTAHNSSQDFSISTLIKFVALVLATVVSLVTFF